MLLRQGRGESGGALYLKELGRERQDTYEGDTSKIEPQNKE